MKNRIARSIAAVAAVAVLAGAAVAGSAHAAEVTINGWAYGSGNQVSAHGVAGEFNGLAGGFVGSLASADGSQSEAFIAYSLELGESFDFGPDAMQGYTVVDGASYFARRRGDAGIAERVGRLMTFALASRSFNASATSTALQLALWNSVYDADDTLAGGAFQDSSQYQGLASKLLYGINSIRASVYDVFVLEMAGSQDFLMVRAREPAAAQPNAVPEPGSLALAMAALGGIGLAGRRRRQA